MSELDVNATDGAIEIPFQPSIGVYRFGCAILGRQYIFDVRWNARDNDGEGAWYFDVLEIDQTPILRGVKIVLGAYMGRSSNHRLFREGVLVAADLSGQEREASFDDLGTRVSIIYIPVLELRVRLAGAPS